MTRHNFDFSSHNYDVFTLFLNVCPNCGLQKRDFIFLFGINGSQSKPYDSRGRAHGD